MLSNCCEEMERGLNWRASRAQLISAGWGRRWEGGLMYMICPPDGPSMTPTLQL